MENSAFEHIVLGIDPGSLKTGFGIIKLNKSGISHVAHGAIILDKKKSLASRINDLAHDLNTVIKKYNPSIAVVEDVFYCKNARSALILGQARGAALALLGLYKIEVEALSPTAVKLMVAGHGRAEKFQVAMMVAKDLGIDIPKHEDASDALALALALGYKTLKGI